MNTSQKPVRKHKIMKWIFLGVILYGFIFVLLIPQLKQVLREHWSKAFDKPAAVKEMDLVVYDHWAEWSDSDEDDASSNEVVVSSGHWLGHNSVDMPRNKPAHLWYDGRLIASERSAHDLLLSPDGKHYAYIRSDAPLHEGDDPEQELIIDGKSYVSGNEFNLLHLPNNTEEVYYDCENCNSTKDSFFSGHRQLAAYGDDISSYEMEETMGDDCLSSSKVDMSKAVTILSDPEVVRLSCSPNGKHFLSVLLADRFPVGNWDILKINGVQVDKANTSDPIVDNQGRPTYLRSNGRGEGELIIRGKEYHFKPLETSGVRLLYSQSGGHLAIVLGDDRWWVDGRPTNAAVGDIVSLEGDTFYKYKVVRKDT